MLLFSWSQTSMKSNFCLVNKSDGNSNLALGVESLSDLAKSNLGLGKRREVMYGHKEHSWGTVHTDVDMLNNAETLHGFSIWNCLSSDKFLIENVKSSESVFTYPCRWLTQAAIGSGVARVARTRIEIDNCKWKEKTKQRYTRNNSFFAPYSCPAFCCTVCCEPSSSS